MHVVSSSGARRQTSTSDTTPSSSVLHLPPRPSPPSPSSDYSLLPLLVEQNYIDSARNGIFKSHGSDAEKLEQLSRAADTISDIDLAGSALRGQDMHWELLPLQVLLQLSTPLSHSHSPQAALTLKVGNHVQGFQGFPTFPQWLGKYSTTNKSKRLTQEIVVHTIVSIRQSFDPIRLEYIPYLRHHLLNLLRAPTSELRVNEEGEPVTAIEEVIGVLDEYGLSRDDLMETMKEMQFLVDNDKASPHSLHL
jgi:replication factor C subunit 1